MLAVVTAYSLISLVTTNESYENNPVSSASNNTAQFFSVGTAVAVEQKKQQSVYQAAVLNDLSHVENGQTSPLPAGLKVLGISDSSDTQNTGESAPLAQVLVQFDNELYQLTISDFIGDSTIQITAIDALSIKVDYQQTIYTVRLTPPNLLASDYKKPQPSYAQMLAMTPQEIGTRPRVIEHLISLTPTPYIADGQLIGPGINPILFEQAGFKTDDVLKSINGKRVTVASEFEDIKTELQTAQTLTFVVMRRGRLITLFLDIPSEALELNAN